MYNQTDENRYRNMNYRRCGKSGILLPEISLGLWHNFGQNSDRKTVYEIVKYAFDHGITYFDLANNYGPPPGAAEENFGLLLKQEFAGFRDEMIIATKAGHRMWPGPYGDGGSRKNILTSIDKSLKRLQIDYVDIFYSHRYDSETPLEETLQALSDIVHQGKALYIGLSKYPIEEAKRAFQLLKAAGTPCLVYQDRYNLITRNVEKQHLDTCQSNGSGFVAFSPLAQGILTGKYLHGIPEDSRAAHPNGFLKREQITPETIRKVSSLQRIAKERKQTLAQMSLSWLLQDHRVTSVITGARSVEQLSSNLECISNTNFSTDELQTIDKILSS